MKFKINNVEIFVALTIILSIVVTVLVAIEALDFPQKH